MDGQIAVTHAHDEAVGAGRVHHQRIRQAFRLDDQRVIARRGEGRGKAREYAGCVMADLAGLAVHKLRRADHLAAERLSDGLMRSEEHTSELQSLMRISYAVFCLKTKKEKYKTQTITTTTTS